MVDDLVVRDAQHPRQEFAVVRITSVVDKPHDFDECLLIYVVCDFIVLHHHANVVQHTFGMTFDEYGNRILIARKIGTEQLLVTKR